MAHCHSESVRCIQVVWHIRLGNGKLSLKHSRYLLLGCTSISGDGLLDLSRSIFHNRDFSAESSSNGNTLSSSQFEHRLNILAEEWGLNGKFIGMKAINEFCTPLVNPLKFQRVIVDFFEPENPHNHQIHFSSLHGDDTVSENVGARVNSQYDAFFSGQWGFFVGVKVIEPMWAVLVIYSLVLGFLRWKWQALSEPPPSSMRRDLPSITIVIACRNEASDICNVLLDIASQEFSGDLPEVIVVDDHSEDQTVQKVNSFAVAHPFIRCVPLTNGEGKKAALECGISAATGKLIATLDADVRIGRKWLSTLMSHYARNGSRMIIMPIQIIPGRSVLTRLQSLEFLSLSVITGSSAKAGLPVLCNGANLAFRKTAWLKSRRYRNDRKLSSGDDMFLLFAIKQAGPGPITYLHHADSIARVEAESSLASFLAQRIRWASKATAFRDGATLLFSGLIFLLNFAALLQLFLLAFGLIPFSDWLLWNSARICVDMGFVVPAATWFRTRSLLWLAPLLSLVYPVYAVSVPLIGFFFRPRWKGRYISLRTR